MTKNVEIFVYQHKHNVPWYIDLPDGIMYIFMNWYHDTYPIKEFIELNKKYIHISNTPNYKHNHAAFSVDVMLVRYLRIIIVSTNIYHKEQMI